MCPDLIVSRPSIIQTFRRRRKKKRRAFGSAHAYHTAPQHAPSILKHKNRYYGVCEDPMIVAFGLYSPDPKKYLAINFHDTGAKIERKCPVFFFFYWVCSLGFEPNSNLVT